MANVATEVWLLSMKERASGSLEMQEHGPGDPNDSQRMAEHLIELGADIVWVIGCSVESIREELREKVNNGEGISSHPMVLKMFAEDSLFT